MEGANKHGKLTALVNSHNSSSSGLGVGGPTMRQEMGKCGNWWTSQTTTMGPGWVMSVGLRHRWCWAIAVGGSNVKQLSLPLRVTPRRPGAPGAGHRTAGGCRSPGGAAAPRCHGTTDGIVEGKVKTPTTAKIRYLSLQLISFSHTYTLHTNYTHHIHYIYVYVDVYILDISYILENFYRMYINLCNIFQYPDEASTDHIHPCRRPAGGRGQPAKSWAGASGAHASDATASPSAGVGGPDPLPRRGGGAPR